MRAGDNPFRVQRLARLAYRLDDTTWEALIGRWDTLGRRAALVGPEGRGKSTLLAELAERLVTRDGFRLRAVILRRGERRLATGDRARLLDGAGARDLLSIDGAQELSPSEWRRLRDASRAAGGLLITSHRAGLLPTLHECRTTPELLADLLGELLRAERREEAIAPVAAADALFARHRGNLRDALLAAYDAYAASDQAASA
ncbi:MAG TPA: hypothetical protein VGS57_13045 [Thermoanaerobaculia bacterium]|jgi:hypothetical protein|nr:hypothetical protein [Thermoanaerobaculia bacterium]